MFCKHTWHVISETTTKSKFEAAVGALGGSGHVKLPWQMSCAERKHIQVFECSKCGKLKRFVETI